MAALANVEGRPERKAPRVRDGFSESLWKSLAVKALRIGWPAGVEEAGRRLSPSLLKSVLVTQIFEDIFPAVSELSTVVDEIDRRDFWELCERETHHGRGWTEAFCKMHKESVRMREEEERVVRGTSMSYGLPYLPHRALSVFWTWHTLQPADAGVKREVDKTPWTEMPKVIADMHTVEGRKTPVTLLSGTYAQHAALARLVAAHGWGRVRELTHAEHLGRKLPPLPLFGSALEEIDQEVSGSEESPLSSLQD